MSVIFFLFSFFFLAWVLFDFKNNYVPQVKNYPYVSGAVIIWIALTIAWITPLLSVFLIVGYSLYQIFLSEPS